MGNSKEACVMSHQILSQHELDLRIGGYSTQGKREVNQDAFIVKHASVSEQPFKGDVVCIADGVSCSDKGQQASHTCVTQFVDDYFSTPDSWSVKQSATKVLLSINSWLYQQQKDNDLHHNGWLTTFSAVVIKSNTAHVFHVGDSRIYLYREDKLQQLTHDHQRQGVGKEAYLTRALGMDSKLDVDYHSVDLQEGDVLLLTTDGVHDVLSNDELSFELSQEGMSQLSLESMATHLCHQALDKDSQDNVSCLLVDVLQLPNKTPQELLHLLDQCHIPPVLKVGQKIDHYRIEEIIYSGVRSHVYLAINEKNAERCVIKAPSLQFSEDKSYLYSYLREQWIGEAVNSKRVMKILPRVSDSRFIYHVCEYIEGITLRQWMRDNPTPELSQMRFIIDGIIKSVRVLQRLQIVHRDLKPENIMITPDNSVVVIDFGAATADGLEEALQVLDDVYPLGELNYTAPEYIRGDKATRQSDIYSIGVVCYEILSDKERTHCLPYKQVTQQGLSTTHPQQNEYYSLLLQHADLPVWIDEAIKKACHILPSKRYQHMSEFMADLIIPNPQLLKNKRAQPLMEREPLLFWKGLSIVLGLIVIIEFAYLI